MRVRLRRDYRYKYAEDMIDKNMLRVVNILNKFRGVYTVGCCGGHKNPKKPLQKDTGTWWVSFDCRYPKILKEICQALSGLNVVIEEDDYRDDPYYGKVSFYQCPAMSCWIRSKSSKSSKPHMVARRLEKVLK